MHKRMAMCVVLVASWGGGRHALADDKIACVKAADAAQEQRSAGRLREARASLHTCARESCPALVRSDCTRWLGEVEASVPTIVIRAEGARGEDLADVQVDLDGQRIADKLEGLPIEIDPGAHVLTCRSAGGKALRQEIVVHTAEKNRAISVRLETVDTPSAALASTGPPSPQISSQPGAAAWIFAGVAVAGAASFAYFGWRGYAEVSDMRSECAGHCPASRVDAAHEKLLAADIALGVSVVSAGVATVLFFRAAKPSAKPPPSREVSVAPLAGGVAAVWVERF